VNVARLTPDGELEWFCPGCKREHRVPVVGGRAWLWNGSTTRPTLEPSVKILPTLVHPLCHSVLTDGAIHFCNDCSHGLGGTLFVMEPLP